MVQAHYAQPPPQEEHRESKLVDRVVDMYYRDPSPMRQPPQSQPGNYSRPGGGGSRWL
jgi:hypothetical protein